MEKMTQHLDNEELTKLAAVAYEAVASACHWGDEWQMAMKTVRAQIQAAYDLGLNTKKPE